MDAQPLQGQVAVIAGGCAGLGLAIARRLGRAGARLVVTAPDAAAEAAGPAQLKQAGLSAAFAPLDVSRPDQSEAVARHVLEREGRLDVWVTVAGDLPSGPAEALRPVDWEMALQATLSGAFYCAQAAGRIMLAQGRGVIVHVGSVEASVSSRGQVAASVAHAGLARLTEALGVEWAPRGVRVVGVAVGVLEVQDDPRRIPLRRAARPDEVAAAVAFLASDEASYITAETLPVDGGWRAYQLF